MNSAQIEENLRQLIQSFNKETFIYDILLAYGQPKASISKLKIGSMNLSKTAGEIIWKKKLFFRSAENADVHEVMSAIQSDGNNLRHEPRFIVVTDYETLLAVDTKTTDTLDIPVLSLPKHYDFFLPWAGMEKAVHQTENPADVKAAERMAKLYDEISKDNPIAAGSALQTQEAVHDLNVFLSRLLFCFFAEDTGIFEKSQFTHAISNHTQADGSDLHTYLDTLFEVLNTEKHKRTSVNGAELPVHLHAFPYVNGGLFRNTHNAPIFGRRSRQMLIESGDLDWSEINPDIFGSMIQAVITPEHRGGLGMHYTSVPNIMKVIEPLFLNELKEEFEAGKDSTKKLTELLKRIWNIKIFDPACGSGNFLIIAYKELRKLEMAIFKEIDRINRTFSTQYSGISLNHFYGIELDDFAHEVATLSLWLAEHQMNQEFFKAFGRAKPALPLMETGKIVQGNATRLDWEVVCPKLPNDEIYILGNPPYLGSSMQSAEQKEDMALVFSGIDSYKNLDYIACWFFKAANFIRSANAQFAFVSTNSICQGEQVALLWPHVLNFKIEIGFAHTSFKWANNAKSNAGVTVIIVGLRNENKAKQKYLFAQNKKTAAANINAYLAPGRNMIIGKRTKVISLLPEMDYGNKPVDGGNLILTDAEKNSLLQNDAEVDKYIKKLVGSNEFINQIDRWCLWIHNSDYHQAIKNLEISKRIERVRAMRMASRDSGANKMATRSHQFREMYETLKQSIVIPSVSSEARKYIPIGFIGSDTIVTNLAFAIYESPTWIFSILTSLIHMTWVRTVGGRLKSDYRYSSALTYNTFPFPPISDTQKQELEKHVYRILEEREAHSEKTLAQLYDPDKMPAGLREAHRQNDLAVERCYRSRPFESDEERLEYLFKQYEQMIAAEKEKGTLFEKEGKSKKVKL